MPEIIESDCLTYMRDQPDRRFKLVIGSPPYSSKGERYIGGTRKKWDTDDWVAWMLDVTTEAVRVCSGMVLWVVNGAVRDGRYLPACEGLVWEWYKRGGWSERSAIWTKNAPPAKRPWFGNDWEFVLAFKRPDAVYPFNWEAVAEPPKYKAGGRFRQRGTNGERRLGSEYPQSKLARPRDVLGTNLDDLSRDELIALIEDAREESASDVFRATVGGGHMGSKLAHDNEAPFPEKVPEHFIKILTNPGDLVLDPFSGSGTTVKVALNLGREAVGVDCRASQVELSKRRLEEVAHV